jgi:hypothetical protein
MSALDLPAQHSSAAPAQRLGGADGHKPSAAHRAAADSLVSFPDTSTG